MEDKIKSAFEGIHADNSLKSNTKDYIYEKTNGYSGRKNIAPRRIGAVVACAVVLLFGIGGYSSYAVPVSTVSMDINPSFELKVNVYGKVVDVEGYNDDGVKLAQELDVSGMSYEDAVNTALDNSYVVSCLEEDNLLEVTVSSAFEKETQKMQECLASQTDIPSENIYCLGNNEDAKTAHSQGISLGKYRAYLELSEINPDITVDDVKDLTMREIRNMINAEKGGNSDSSSGAGGQGNGQNNGQSSNQGNSQNSSQGNQNGQGNKYQYGKNN